MLTTCQPLHHITSSPPVPSHFLARPPIPDPLSSPPMGGTSLGRLHQHTLADSESHLSTMAMQERFHDCRTVAPSAWWLSLAYGGCARRRQSGPSVGIGDDMFDRAEARGQIFPLRSGPQNPENPIQDGPGIVPWYEIASSHSASANFALHSAVT
jgi:hypothetical protein